MKLCSFFTGCPALILGYCLKTFGDVSIGRRRLFNPLQRFKSRDATLFFMARFLGEFTRPGFMQMKSRFGARCFAFMLALCIAMPAMALVCSPNDPGNPLSAGGIVNTYYPGTSTNLSAGSTSVPVGLINSGGSQTPISAGDMLLIIQMQDADINSDNSSAYGSGGGTGSGYTTINQAGQYEYAIAAGPVTGGAAPITVGLTNAYRTTPATGTKGQSTYQVVRVPRYSSFTASGGSAAYWNGATGGVFTVDVAGTFSGSVDVSGRGFRGGGGRGLGGQNNNATDGDYRNRSTRDVHGQKGEGIAGTPQHVYDQQNLQRVDTGIEGYPNGSSAQGAPGNAGGGGTDGNVSANDQNSGGGGGGNGGGGGQGGNTWSSNDPTGGRGGASIAPAFNRVVLGGGGGAGSRNNSTDPQSSGGAGGGIVLIRAGSVTAATFTANGATGSTPANDGGGGGGAGGSIVVTGLSGSFSANARGASGTNADIGGSPHGPGGGGGGGVVLSSTGVSASSNVSGGTNGTTVNSTNAYGAIAGANDLTSGIVSEASALGANSGSQCIPQLTVTKTTVPAGVVTVNPGGTVTYSITVANAAMLQTATQVVLSDVLPGLPTPFANASATPAVVLGGGATRPTAVNSAVGATSPSWSGFIIPGGGSVKLDFSVTVPVGTTLQTYQNTATATYLDPKRTVNTGTNASSSNATASTNDDVRVAAAPAVVKAFLPASIGVGNTSVLTITLSNANATAISGTAFTDTYPLGVLNTATPAGATTCGSGVVVAGANGANVALSGATIPANGSCTVTVNIKAATAGTYPNSIPVGGVTTTNAGANTAAATATLSVLNPLAVAKSFSPATIAMGGTSVLTILLTNPNATAITGAALTDTYPAKLLNTASGASAATTCLSGSVSGANGGTSLALTTGTVPANGSCTVTVNVTSAAAGSYLNSTGVVATANAGPASAGSATLTVAASPSISKAFTPTTIIANGLSTMSFVIVNPNGIALTGMAFTDNFPTGGLQVAPAPNVANSCNGTISGATSGSVTVSLTGGTLAAGANCTISLAVTSSIPGAFSNTTTGVSANETTTGAGANAVVLTVVSPDLQLTKSHTGNFTAGTQGTYMLLVNNTSGAAPTIGAITVTDTLPTGLVYVAAGSGGTGWTCSVSGQLVSCTSSTVIAAGAVNANPITINVSVAATAAPSVTNSASVSGGGEPTANAGNNMAFDPTVVVLPAQNTFQPDGVQTALPGTTVFYAHTFNAALAGTVSFGTTNSPAPAVAGWGNVIYRDSDCNGLLNGTEGTAVLASSIGVASGTTVCIVIKEFVPAGAPYNAVDVITVIATFTPATGSVVTLTRTDTTTLGAPGGAGLTLSKTVRNVTTGGSAGTSNAAKSGETIEYTISYNNVSVDPLATIVINDSTPAFTQFDSAACGAPLPANVTACNVTTQPATGSTGAIAWTLNGSLASTQYGSVIFRVKLQ